MNFDDLLALHRIDDDFRHRDVPLAQLAQVGVRALDVAGAGIGGDAEQAIGDLRQRRDDDDGPARVAAFLLRVGLPLGAHDRNQALDRGLVGDRRAAELHHHHRPALRWSGAAALGQSNTPSASHQFGVENRGAGGAAHRVVPERDELGVRHLAGAHAADGDRHAVAAIGVESRLRPVRLEGTTIGGFGARGQRELLRTAAELP